MTMKIKDPKDPSKEIEVYTPEEVEAAKKEATETATKAASDVAEKKAQEAIDKYKQEHPDQTDAIQKMKDEIEGLTGKLEAAEGFDDGTPERKAQIDRLRKERDEKVEKMGKEVETLTGTIKSMQDSQLATEKNRLLDQYAGKDPEVRKKVEFEFDSYRPNDNEPAQLTERMEKAAQLAGVEDGGSPSAMDQAGGHGGTRGDGTPQGAVPKKPTENAVSIGKNIGVSEEDLQKHLDEKNAGGDKK